MPPLRRFRCRKVSPQARPSASSAAIFVGAFLAIACAVGCDAPAALEQVEAAPATCLLGQTGHDGQSFDLIDDGGDVELTRGYQGYLLVLLRLQATASAPRSTRLIIRAGRADLAHHDSLNPRVTWEPLLEGGARSEPFEVWLSPALVSEFVGRQGSIRVTASNEAGQVVCVAERKVRFVDDDICMHYDDGSLACVAQRGQGGETALDPADSAVLARVLAVRAGSQALATAAWPQVAAWPGYALHNSPIYLVIRDEAGAPRRGYLIGSGEPPTGAKVLQSKGFGGVARWDGGLKELWDGIEGAAAIEVGGIAAIVLGVGPVEAKAPGVALDLRLGALAMVRLREVDAPWRMVLACGQPGYPRVAEAIALLLLECAVLDEALLASDHATRQQRLVEWAAVRSAAFAASQLVGQRFRHYDNTFAAERFAALRVAYAGAADPAAAIVAAHRAALALPATVPIDGFDALMANNGDIAAAALEVSTRAGLDPAADYAAAKTVLDTIVAAWGVAPASALTAAQARHPWASFQARAALIAALPEITPGLGP